MDRGRKESRVTFQGRLRRRQQRCRGGGCPSLGGFFRNPWGSCESAQEQSESGEAKRKGGGARGSEAKGKSEMRVFMGASFGKGSLRHLPPHPHTRSTHGTGGAPQPSSWGSQFLTSATCPRQRGSSDTCFTLSSLIGRF